MEKHELRKDADEGLSRSLTDLKECNKEKIHLISTVQGRGAALFFTWPDQRVQAASENIGDYIEASHRDVIGSKLAHVLEAELVRFVSAKIGEYPWAHRHGRYFRYESNLVTYDCYLFHSDGLFGLELEKAGAETMPSDSFDSQTVTEHVMTFHSEMKVCRDVAELAHLACKTIRSITQLDRVTLYKFLYPSWHGEVIGEDRVMQAHSYMGHRFPSSDIPQPARELYLRNKVRIISDVNEPVSKVTPPTNPVTGKPIDLSDSRLRGASLIHLEYLRNMGVRASLSFAITVRGELLGLIACHHFTTFGITQEQRNACELIAEAYSAHAPLLETLNSYRSKFAFQTRLENVLNPIREAVEQDDPTESIFKGHAIADIFGASGFALAGGPSMEFTGLTPRPAGISELAARLQEELRKEIKPVLAISNLHERLPNLTNTDKLVAGVLAVRLKDESILMIFRPEVIKTITWGGDPVKQLDKKGLRGEINPRKSFDAWKEVIHGTCTDWQPYEISGAEELAETLNQLRLAGGKN